jgi:hypothetical protein
VVVEKPTKKEPPTPKPGSVEKVGMEEVRGRLWLWVFVFQLV